MFSFEVPEIFIQVEGNAFGNCYSLRNIALASKTAVAENAFVGCHDLLQIFGTKVAIVNALQYRFNRLPVHSKMYYMSYHNQMTSEKILNSIIIGENGELDPTGFEQDCLGMTPLHIMACSTVQQLEVYRLMIDKYPDNLIIADAWGATPLLYALWGDAPNKIIHFLINSYQSLYPDHEFEWSTMLITLGQANAPEGVIQNLLDVQSTLYPEQNINWDQVLGVLVEFTEWGQPHAKPKTFCFLTRCSISTRINAIGVKHFRDAMADDWMGNEDDFFDRDEWHNETITKLEYYESEYRKLKEMTSLLELALWTIKLNDSKGHDNSMGSGNKKIKIDQSNFRVQCRISCGADQVVENVLPYLLSSDYVRSYVPNEDNNNFDSDCDYDINFDDVHDEEEDDSDDDEELWRI
jgi:hypothetical protein